MLKKSIPLYSDVATCICTNCATFLAKMPLKMIESVCVCVLGGGGGGGKRTPRLVRNSGMSKSPNKLHVLTSSSYVH